MADMVKRKVRLEIEWGGEKPDVFCWRTIVWGYVPDDSEEEGCKCVMVSGEQHEITRTIFRAISGQQIENNAVSAANELLQGVGSGAGGHDIEHELGN